MARRSAVRIEFEGAQEGESAVAVESFQFFENPLTILHRKKERE